MWFSNVQSTKNQLVMGAWRLVSNQITDAFTEYILLRYVGEMEVDRKNEYLVVFLVGQSGPL